MRIIGITGGVASGKTTYANQLAAKLRAAEQSVEVVSTDGFIFPLKTLQEKGLLSEKGSPRTHDLALMQEFLGALRRVCSFAVPLYSHSAYDRLEDTRTVSPADVLLLEGVGVAGLVRQCQVTLSQTKRDASAKPPGFSQSDDCDTCQSEDNADTYQPENTLLDEIIFIDTPLEVAKERYLKRVRKMLQAPHNETHPPARENPHYAGLTFDAAMQKAEQIWEEVNLPNYVKYIEPVRNYAQEII